MRSVPAGHAELAARRPVSEWQEVHGEVHHHEHDPV
jgi:hypothetical protein